MFVKVKWPSYAAYYIIDITLVGFEGLFLYEASLAFETGFLVLDQRGHGGSRCDITP